MGFSLIELLVVIAVALVLAGFLFPAMAQVKENAHRVVCSSNLRQIGIALQLYADNNGGMLPFSAPLMSEPPQPQELMSASRGKHALGPQEWDGLGLLFRWGYCSAPDCFYCPSHHGQHAPERYRDAWLGLTAENAPIYTNYHYSGHKEWNLNRPRRIDEDDPHAALATDGLRSTEDFNHRVGMNVLAFDGSVRWRDDNADVFESLPEPGAPIDLNSYRRIWGKVETD